MEEEQRDPGSPQMPDRVSCLSTCTSFPRQRSGISPCCRLFSPRGSCVVVSRRSLFERHHALPQPCAGRDGFVVPEGDDVRLHVPPFGRRDRVPVGVLDGRDRLAPRVRGRDGVENLARVAVGDDGVARVVRLEDERGHRRWRLGHPNPILCIRELRLSRGVVRALWK